MHRYIHTYIHTYILYLFVVITANIEGPYIIFLWQGTSSYFAAMQDDCGDMCFAFIQFGGRNRVGRGTSIYMQSCMNRWIGL